jgi:tRNA (guanine37-N1)-methyltransferase
MIIHVLTLFPEMIEGIIGSSILGKAMEKGVLDIRVTNIRQYSQDKHHKVDDTPFGGGAGMVMTVQPIFDAIRDLGGENKRMIYLSPKGRLPDQDYLQELAREKELFLLCGHYEGVDQRILDHFAMEEVSIGDYVLTGGELPAMILLDAMARFVPEVLGSSESVQEESIYMGLLEYPQYTKPRMYEGMAVPDVLLNGNHRLIENWKLEQALRLTRERRPDLFEKFVMEKESSLSKEEKKILKKVQNEFET